MGAVPHPKVPAARRTLTGPEAGSWLRRHAAKLGWQQKQTLGSAADLHQKEAPALADVALNAIDLIATSDRVMRSTQERLAASLKQRHEALSPRVLRRTLQELRAVADPNVSEVEGGRRAQGVAQWYAKASAHAQRDMWLLMSEQFAPDAQQLRQASPLTTVLPAEVRKSILSEVSQLKAGVSLGQSIKGAES